MARLIGVTLEIATDPKAGRARQLNRALAVLRRARIAGHAVVGVVGPTDGQQPSHAPDFGHSYHCQCLQPEPFGVDRYFSVCVALAGEAELADIICSYWLQPGESQIFVGLMVVPYSDLVDLEKVIRE